MARRATVELANFSESEVMGVKPVLLARLQVLRDLVGEPVHVTSGFRPGDDKSHGVGLAVDISDNGVGRPVTSRWRFKVLQAAVLLGFNRIGLYDRHVHLDLWTGPEVPQDVIWTGTSE